MVNLEGPLKELIKERYGSVRKFAKSIGLSPSTIYSALDKNVVGSSLTTVAPILAGLGLDPFELAQGRITALPAHPEGSVEVPLYGSISAGAPAEALVAEDRFPVPAALHEKFPDAFFLKVSGESMNRILPNGCYALVDPCSDVDFPNAPYAVAVGAGNATVKRVRPLANGLELVPDSHDPTYRPRLYDFGDPTAEDVRIIGRVVWHAAPLEWRLGV